MTEAKKWEASSKTHMNTIRALWAKHGTLEEYQENFDRIKQLVEEGEEEVEGEFHN